MIHLFRASNDMVGGTVVFDCCINGDHFCTESVSFVPPDLALQEVVPIGYDRTEI